MATNVNSLSQYAALSIFENGFDFLIDYRSRLMARSEMVFQSVSQHLSNKIVNPQGGFFYFLNISQYVSDSNIFCAEMMDKTGVAMTPGIAFGEDWNQYVRLSFGVNEDQIKIGLDKFSNFLKTYGKTTD